MHGRSDEVGPVASGGATHHMHDRKYRMMGDVIRFGANGPALVRFKLRPHGRTTDQQVARA